MQIRVRKPNAVQLSRNLSLAVEVEGILQAVYLLLANNYRPTDSYFICGYRSGCAADLYSFIKTERTIYQISAPYHKHQLAHEITKLVKQGLEELRFHHNKITTKRNWDYEIPIAKAV